MSTATLTQSADILLIEDNLTDIQLAREAIKEGQIAGRLKVARSGELALRMLREERRPDLILLDLNLPKKSGIELLAEIKSDPDLRRIPVIVLTSSTSQREVRRSYDLHANCYLTKPLDMDEFVRALKLIEELWLTRAELPSQ